MNSLRMPFILVQRNWVTERPAFMLSLILLLLEPIALFWGFGIGLGDTVDAVDQVSYSEYLFPGLLCFSAMVFSFVEACWGTMGRWRNGPVLKQLAITPFSLPQIVYGELLWAMIHGLIGAGGLFIFGLFVGLSTLLDIAYLVPVLALAAFLGAQLGLLAVASLRRHSGIVFISNFLAFPLAFLSGIFFPLEALPWVFRLIGFLSPMYHVAEFLKYFYWADFTWHFLVHAAYLILLPLILNRFLMKQAAAKFRELASR